MATSTRTHDGNVYQHNGPLEPAHQFRLQSVDRNANTNYLDSERQPGTGARSASILYGGDRFGGGGFGGFHGGGGFRR